MPSHSSPYYSNGRPNYTSRRPSMRHRRLHDLSHPHFGEAEHLESSRSFRSPQHALRASLFALLPLELQTEIFVCCLPPYSRFDASDAPLLLCHVCPTWRTLAFSIPKLWASFEIEVASCLDDLRSERRRHVLEALNTWLAHSQKHLLSVRVLHNPTGRKSDDLSSQILSLLFPQAYRWLNIHLLIPSSSMEVLQNDIPGRYPELRTLALEIKGLWNTIVPFNIRALRIPWGQLTGLHLHLDQHNRLSLEDFLDILRHSHHLIQCSVELNCSLRSKMESTERTALRSLERLRLILHSENPDPNSGSSLSSCANLFEQLSFPNLRVLQLDWQIRTAGQDWSIVHPSFLSALQESSDTIETLAFSYLPVTEDQLVECLARLPRVDSLTLRFSLIDWEHDPIRDDFFSACSFSKHPPILPLLRTMYVQCSGSRYSNSSLVGFVESRLSSDWDDDLSERKLQSFTLLSTKAVSNHLRQKCAVWRDLELDVLIEDITIA